ncbi:MAG: hypothetical protein AAFP77_22205 [Bacteroidota bacterium]
MSSTLLAQLSNSGLLLFVALYIYASTRYDGGSKVDPHRKSWDWIHNYWCDLIWPTTLLDEPNRASKWGITANFVLCFSFIFFFWAFSYSYPPSSSWQLVIGISGTIAMICAMLIFSKVHDAIMGGIILSAIPAVTGVIYGLIVAQQDTALYGGAVALVLVLVNIYIFYTNHGEHYLPFVQKIAFVAVISWAFFINSSIA